MRPIGKISILFFRVHAKVPVHCGEDILRSNWTIFGQGRRFNRSMVEEKFLRVKQCPDDVLVGFLFVHRLFNTFTVFNLTIEMLTGEQHLAAAGLPRRARGPSLHLAAS